MMKAFRAAALQVRTRSPLLTVDGVMLNVEHSVRLIRRCVEETGSELLVLPESVTTGFTPNGSVQDLWHAVSAVPGHVTTEFQAVAADLKVHLCLGTYERGQDESTVYNSSVLIGPDGAVLGTYRKTHPFGNEHRDNGGWSSPGDDVCVVDTALGRIGMIICFDGDFPELARIQAVQGAEILCRPSALLRSADIWELTSRARAYDNHVFLVGANATGVDAAGAIYFGNSHVVTPMGDVVARAASHEGWVSVVLDPATALSSLTIGSNVRQPFDHLADRNLSLIRRHVDALYSTASTSFERGVV